MRRPTRKLSTDEAAAWAQVARTVRRLADIPDPSASADLPAPAAQTTPPPPSRRLPRATAPRPQAQPAPPPTPPARPLDRHGLDAGWDRKLARGLVPPDFTLDLHGATLDAAHARLEHGLMLALAQQARLVLLITGRSRPSEDRGGRGVIRRKFMDWLAAGPYAGRIAAIRPAHPRHGGAGAVYIVLKRPK